jgi:hypothetical protein
VQNVRDAARDLARESTRVPGQGRVIFQTVADVALIGTAVLSGALAAVTLWKALFRRHAGEPHPAVEPASGGAASPPRRHHPPAPAGGDSDSFLRRHRVTEHAQADRHAPGERY